MTLQRRDCPPLFADSESDSQRQLVLLMVLESNCQTKSGTSRLSPTQLFSEQLPTLCLPTMNQINNGKLYCQ
ncbi:MAG: hypothetical protein LBK82_00410 [Planctomycetaceae bacterium]|nr:hypothetical protein [Planctomycetaceae bacterium]